MSRRNIDADQMQYEQNCANYLTDNCGNYQNTQRLFKKVSSNNSRKSAYKNPEPVISNYQTYFVPVTNYDATAKVKQQSIHAHYSYSSNSLYPTYMQEQDKLNDGRNKVIYLKYPNEDNLQFKNSKYNSKSNYLLKEQENFYEYDFVAPTPNYIIENNNSKSNYKNSQAQLSKMVYSSYVPEVDVKFANNTNFYYPYSSEPSISSQRSFDDILDYPVNRCNNNEEPEKISASKGHAQDLNKKFPDMLKRSSKPNFSNKPNKNSNYYRTDSVYGTPCNETPTRQFCTNNAITQTTIHNLKLNNEYSQTEGDAITSRSKETQTLNALAGNPYFCGLVNNLAKKGFFLYSCYLKMTVVRWLRRIIIELAWSVYNCPSNCPMQDRIISSYLNHIERKVSTDLGEFQSTCNSGSPSRRSCKKPRIK